MNQEYFNDVRKRMTKIEKRYIPFVKFLSENVNEI